MSHRTRHIFFRHHWWLVPTVGTGLALIIFKSNLPDRGSLFAGVVAAVLSVSFFVQQQRLAEMNLFWELISSFNGRYDKLHERLMRMRHEEDCSATARAEEPHVNHTTRTNTVVNALKRRAQAVLNDRSIDPQSRAIIRYALEINDPWLERLVRRTDAGENVIEQLETLETNENGLSEEKVEALTEMICRAGDEPGTKSAALVVLMATLEDSRHPKALANTAKHLAFTRCGGLNLNGIVDAQIEVFERELFAN